MILIEQLAFWSSKGSFLRYASSKWILARINTTCSSHKTRKLLACVYTLNIPGYYMSNFLSSVKINGRHMCCETCVRVRTTNLDVNTSYFWGRHCAKLYSFNFSAQLRLFSYRLLYVPYKFEFFIESVKCFDISTKANLHPFFLNIHYIEFNLTNALSYIIMTGSLEFSSHSINSRL